MFWILKRLSKDEEPRRKPQRHPEVEEPLEKLLRDKLGMWELSADRDKREQDYHD